MTERRALPIRVEGHTFTLHPPGLSLDELVDLAVDGPEPIMPYWAHCWPASIALARHLLQLAPLTEETLELGCGLGLVGLAARAAGSPRVLQTDREPEALEAAAAGAATSGLDRVEQAILDWNAPTDVGTFGLVAGADVLYETRYAREVLDVIERTLAPGGIALLADPTRGTAEGALPLLRERFVVTTLRAPIVVDGDTVKVAIHELTRFGR